MIFVAKRSPERTRVPRRVTDRLTVRCLVNINPGRPRTSSTVAPRKPQQHRLRSPSSESKIFFFLKQAHGVKRAIEEAGEGGGVVAPARRAWWGSAAPARWAWGGAGGPTLGGTAAHAHRGEAAPARGGEATVKPPRRKVARQLVVPLRAPKVNVEDASFLVKMPF
jgi:hypothetical protein